MLSAGAGASSGTAAGPRAVLEPAVGASPDDISEGDRLNLAINNFSPSEVAATPDMRLLDRHLPAGVEDMIWLIHPHLPLPRLLPLPL